MEGGEPCCVGLANHVSRFVKASSEDRYALLLDWGADGGILSPGELHRLRAEAGRHPDAARRAAERGVAVARLIRRVLTARATGDALDPADLNHLNRELAVVFGGLGLRASENGYSLAWCEADANLEKVLWPAIRSAAELLTSPDPERLKICDAPDCRWLFLDRSRNGRRRWCDMKVCGNREKVRRHRRAARPRSPSRTAG